MEFTCSNSKCRERLEIPDEYAGQSAECPFCHATVTVPVLPQRRNKLMSPALVCSLGALGALAVVAVATVVFIRHGVNNAPTSKLASTSTSRNASGSNEGTPSVGEIPEFVKQGGEFWSSPQQVLFCVEDQEPSVRIESGSGLITWASATNLSSEEFTPKHVFRAGSGYWIWPAGDSIGISTNGKPTFRLNWHTRSGQPAYKRTENIPQGRMHWTQTFESGNQQRGLSLFGADYQDGVEGGSMEITLPFSVSNVSDAYLLCFITTEADGRSNLLEIWFKRERKFNELVVASKRSSRSPTGSTYQSTSQLKFVVGGPLVGDGWRLLIPGGAFLRTDPNDTLPPPGGLVQGIVIDRNPEKGILETPFIRLIPPQQTNWLYEIRPTGAGDTDPRGLRVSVGVLRFDVEKDALRALALRHERGVLFTSDTTLDAHPGITWLRQAAEIVNAKGEVVRTSQP